MKCTACNRVVRKHYIRIAKAVTLTTNYATGERRRFEVRSILCTAVCARSAIFSGVFDDGTKVQKWEQLWAVDEMEAKTCAACRMPVEPSRDSAICETCHRQIEKRT